MERLHSSYLIMSKWLVFISLVFSSFGAQAIQITSFSESYSETVQVSGQLLRGIQYLNNSPTVEPTIYFANPHSGNICIEISSIDGRYKSRYEYLVSEPTQGWLTVPFPTNYKSELEEFSNSELALLASSAASCDVNKRKYLIGSWGQPNVSEYSPHKYLVLLRSSARRNTLAVFNKSNPTADLVKCSDLPSNYRVSFDKQCVFEVKTLNEITTLTIERRNLRPIPDTNIELLR